ncbi:hypothetical protein [Kamptonema sp. UHCC 0994]|nr:hypothetical protein [Kamptonema sp. UHCC 0994]MDF0556873.1 hypothetical protein [Kamptonema sp. UHCC 0994]
MRKSYPKRAIAPFSSPNFHSRLLEVTVENPTQKELRSPTSAHFST